MKMKSFIDFLGKYDPVKNANLQKVPFAAIVKKYKLPDNAVDFLGHAVALYTNDSFLKQPASAVIEKILLYRNSMGGYGDTPFIYPVYGLAGIPEGFSRKCALFGGTFMLNQPVEKFEFD